MASRSSGLSPRTRICAFVVVIALAALAAYTMFSGPTNVAVRLPEKTRVAPAEGRGTENEGEPR